MKETKTFKTKISRIFFILLVTMLLLMLTVITENLFTIKSLGADIDGTKIDDAAIVQAPEKEDINTWNTSKKYAIGGQNVKGTDIPKKFDLRDYINLKVETQYINGTTYAGTCYAFAALNSVESYIMLRGGEEYNFSEMHVEYIAYGGAFKGGGFSSVTSNYFKKTKTDANGNTVPLGPVLESEIPYRKYSTTEVTNKLKKATPIVKVEQKTSYADEWSDDSVTLTEFRNMIKTHIMENGALYAYMYWNDSYYNSSTAGFYYNGSTESNHAVTIIGWDDNYSKENFNKKPKNDGAWIALNSYYKGSSHGDNGVIYISYKDVYINDGMQGVTKVSALNDTEGPNITMSNYKNENNTISIDVDVIDNGANGLNFDELKYQWTKNLNKPSKESFTDVIETETALDKLNTMTLEKSYEDGEEWHLWILAVDNGGNYTIAGDNEVLESTYDLRDHMNIKIESQYMDTEDGKEYLATGYAFSTLNSVETNIMINGGQEYDFSEMHVEYIGEDGDFDGGTFSYVLSNYFNKTKTDSEGNTVPLGPVLESEVSYRKYTSTEVTNILKTATPIAKVEKTASYIETYNADMYTESEIETLKNKIKKHIRENGSVYACTHRKDASFATYYNSETYGYNYTGSGSDNCTFSIIGWDDNYSKENFNKKPKNDGAWIALNPSFKEDTFGDNGVFYISYEDYWINQNMYGVVKVSGVNDTEGPNITMRNFKDENNKISVKVDVIDNGANGLNFDELKYKWTTSLEEPSKDSFTEIFENGTTLEKTYKDGENWYLWILAVDKEGYYTISRLFEEDITTPSITVINGTIIDGIMKISVEGEDTESGVATNGYSFDGGVTWGKNEKVIENNITELKVVIKDRAGNNSSEHKLVVDNVVAATCEEEGKTKGLHCSTCNKVIIAQEKIEELGHTEVIDQGVPAICEEEGLTEGSHCSVCNKVIKAQEKIEALGHYYKDGRCNICNKKQEIFIETSKYETDEENYIRGIDLKTTLNTFKENIKDEYSIKVFKGEEQITEGKIGTGMRVEVMQNDRKTAEYKIIILGDVNGDGEANLMDILAINRHRLNKVILQGDYIEAGDVTKDEKTDLNDILKINRYRLGKINAL